MKTILILAVSNLDAQQLKRDVESYHADTEVGDPPKIVVATVDRDMEGLAFDEFLMTEAFAGQRSIRLLSAALRGARKAGATEGVAP